MLPSFRELILDSAISSIDVKDANNELSVCTNDKSIYLVDLLQLKIRKRIPLQNEGVEEEFDYYKRPLITHGKFAFFKLTPESKEFVFNFEKKVDGRLMFDYVKDEGIAKACFSEDATLLLTGSEEGKTHLIDTELGSLVYEFPFSSDSISALCFSDEKRFAVSASFDKSLKILHVNSLSVNDSIKIDSIIEKMEFISTDIFLAITRDGRVFKIDAKNTKILDERTLPNNVWPSELCVSFSKKFVYIGSRDSQLFVLHVQSMNLVYSLHFNRSGVTSMVRMAKYFVIGYKSGEIQFFNHREFEEDFILHIKLQQLQEARALFEKNIFLMTHRETRKIYELWLERKDSIVTLISTGILDKAQELANDFLFHPKCKQEMEAIEELQPDLMALQRYIRSGAYSAAYELVEAKPNLKSTLLYEKLENVWKRALQQAQILLSRDPLLNKEKAKEVLAKFLHVESKKEFIQTMLNNTKVFIRAEQAVKNKNFILYFELTREYSFLEFTPLYKKVLSLAQKIKLNILNHLKEDQYMPALESLKLLRQFFPFKENAKKLEEFISSLMVIEYHLKNEKLLEAIQIQNKLRIHATYKPIQELNKVKIQFIKKMVQQIQEHKFDETFQSIQACFSIKICIRETAMIMKQMYLEQMKKAHDEENNDVHWENTIIKYGKYFNIDNLIEEFYTILGIDRPLEELILNKQIKKRDYIKNILVFKEK